MRVAVYARVSDDLQKEKQTIESQLAEVRQFAKEQDWPLDEQHIYADDGYSGFYFERPALDRLRDAARDGLIDLLLVHDPDRFARRYCPASTILPSPVASPGDVTSSWSTVFLSGKDSP